MYCNSSGFIHIPDL